MVDIKKKEEEDEEEDASEDYSPGEVYYPSVRLYSEYIEEFNQVTSGNNDTATYKTLCESVNDTIFSKKDFGNRCYKVAKYLDFIKNKQVENNSIRCKCLNYLLNSKENFNTFSSYECSEMFKAYKKISTDREICTTSLDCISKEDVEKITKLYVLHDTFTEMQKYLEADDENTYSTAETFAKHYGNSIYDCQTNSVDAYCEALNEIESLCYQITKSKNCTEIAKLMKYQKALNRAVKIIIPCIITLVIPFFLYTLYKFTLFGSWVNSKILKKTYIRNNLYPESELQNHSSQQWNLENNKYNIKYYTT
ncbi:PIR Superfamily Protein [Plasmodium ovale wallikeri]|uniref:Plasmodium vivax Vir protein, putative n=2 Tax=Plasmodium ovale TaxID=36330 RepID=A0A1C3KGW6_PLAOA|nr:PIR Superfamily Protein [Plasmodium ovale wallikeri]SBT72955.1 Plasmodium vivax Vir protein, putative [Plasmodium ovale]